MWKGSRQPEVRWYYRETSEDEDEAEDDDEAEDEED
jgi:hypothetical protein